MSATSLPPGLRLIRFPDVALLLAATPILLLIDVPAAGYLVGAAAWILLRALGLAVDRRASLLRHVVQQASLRLGYRMARVVLLALAAVLASKAGGKDDGLLALLVILTAFTVQLAVAIVERPGAQ